MKYQIGQPVIVSLIEGEFLATIVAYDEASLIYDVVDQDDDYWEVTEDQVASYDEVVVENIDTGEIEFKNITRCAD